MHNMVNKAKINTMTTNTTAYEFAHGHKPKGRGCWFFEITGTDNKGAYTTGRGWTAGNLTLSEAKAIAIKEFKSSNSRIKRVTGITVLP